MMKIWMKKKKNMLLNLIFNFNFNFIINLILGEFKIQLKNVLINK